LVLSEIAPFLRELLIALVSLLPRFTPAWIFSFAFLVLVFSTVKHRVRHRVTHFDNGMRYWARGLRYRDREDIDTERVGLSWFFRFWTNFASAPSLSFFSLAVPFWWWRGAAANGTAVAGGRPGLLEVAAPWLFPGVCYAGSMLLSFTLKRVFKRVRPPREGFAFGHKLKDPSFPSGHSLTSFCFWLPMAAIFTGSTIAPALVVPFWLAALCIVALTGLSRVYLGVHFPSDVLGGYFIGLVWLIACFIALMPVLASKTP
jgi:membrane-associated phospholipid phosphatase